MKKAVMQWTISSMDGYRFCWAGPDKGETNDCNQDLKEGTEVTWRVCHGYSQPVDLLKCAGWYVDYA